MTIEVTEADVDEFVKLSGWDDGDWDPSFTKTVIAAAWEVLRKRHADTLADAVKEAMQQTQKGKVVVEFCGFGDECLVDVVNRQTRKNLTRSISLDDNFSQLATAAVRQLSQQVRN